VQVHVEAIRKIGLDPAERILRSRPLLQSKRERLRRYHGPVDRPSERICRLTVEDDHVAVREIAGILPQQGQDLGARDRGRYVPGRVEDDGIESSLRYRRRMLEIADHDP